MQSLVTRKTLESISLDQRREGEIPQDRIIDINISVEETACNIKLEA
jgi:hypothetical protein